MARLPRADRVAAWVGLPPLGAVAGWLVDLGAGALAGSGIPVLRALFRLLALGTPPVAAGVGALLGLGLAALARWDELIDLRLWVAGRPGLPPGGEALLLARSKLDPDRREDREELRRELARIGVVVRDEGRKQYVRVVDLG